MLLTEADRRLAARTFHGIEPAVSNARKRRCNRRDHFIDLSMKLYRFSIIIAD